MAPNIMEGKLMRKCDIQLGRARKIIKQAMEHIGLDPSIVWTKELEAECLRIYEEQGPDPAPKALWEYMYPELCQAELRSDKSTSSGNEMSVTETEESEHSTSSGPLSKSKLALENAKPSALKARQRTHRRSIATTAPKVRKSIKGNRESVKKIKELADSDDVTEVDESEICRSPKQQRKSTGMKTPKSARKERTGDHEGRAIESGIDWLPFDGEEDDTERDQTEKSRKTPRTPKKEKVNKRLDDSEGLDMSDEFDIHEVFDNIDASEAFDPFDEDAFESKEESFATPKKIAMVAKKPVKKAGKSRRSSSVECERASPEHSSRRSSSLESSKISPEKSAEKPAKLNDLSDEELLMELLRRKEQRRGSTEALLVSPKKHEPTFDGQVPDLEETSDTDSSDEGKAKEKEATKVPRHKQLLENDQPPPPPRRLTRKAPVQV